MFSDFKLIFIHFLILNSMLILNAIRFYVIYYPICDKGFLFLNLRFMCIFVRIFQNFIWPKFRRNFYDESKIKF